MAFLDPRPVLRKTASPFFRLNFLDSDKLPGGKVEDTQKFENAKRKKFVSGVPESIASRLSEIRYTNEREKGDKLDLIFRSVSVADMDTVFFAKGVGYELYLGWWDWLTTVRNTARVFSGITVSNSFDYDEMGVNITLTLEHKGLAKAREPIPLDVFSGEHTTRSASRGRVRKTRPVVRSVKSALREMAKYLGVRLAWAVKKPATKKYLEDDILSKKDAPPWALPLFMMKVTPNGNPIMKRTTAADFLVKLARTYGQVWYIQSNVLYFGTAENTPLAKVRKIFRYREQGGLKNLLNPVDEDTFKTLTPVKSRNTGTKSKVLVIDDKKKQMKYMEAKAEDVNSIPDTAFIYKEKGVIDAEGKSALSKLARLKQFKIRTAKAQAENRIVTEAEKQNNVDPGRPMPATANSEEDGKAQIEGRTEKAKATMMALMVAGAKGDPFFGIWDLFQVSGASNLQGHNGVYTTVKAIHVLNRDSGYSMDITGTKSQPLRTKEFNKLQDDLVKGADERKASNILVTAYKEKGNTELVLDKEVAATKNGRRDGPRAER